MSRGFYVAFEGGEGSGKSTQAEKLYLRFQKEFPEKKVVLTREPGGTEVSEAVRKILKDHPFSDGQMLGVTETYLFAAARAQSLREVVEPVLEEGGIVLSDRSVYSSLAYQALPRNLEWELIWRINSWAVGHILPNKVVLIDIPIEEGLARIKDKRTFDRLDNKPEAYHKAVRESYLLLADHYSEVFIVIDGLLSVEEQTELIWAKLSPFLDRELRQEGRIKGERG